MQMDSTAGIQQLLVFKCILSAVSSQLPGKSKKVDLFGGLWSKMYETDFQN